jgi:tRNA(Ile2) C34 agmatinyltransferase TiaS
MIYVGIDDTDTLETRGTNRLARHIVRLMSGEYRCVWIARHQLLFDPRVPYTSKNGSASIVLEPLRDETVNALADRVEAIMRGDFYVGSDPGLCVTNRKIAAITAFGQRCQQALIKRDEARTLAAEHDIVLRGLGGTEDGVIGALAAVGLAMAGNDGRVIQLGDSDDDKSGWQSIEQLRERGVVVRTLAENQPVNSGLVDIGKKLRPNLRDRQFVLFVESIESQPSSSASWRAVKLV